MVGRFLSSDGKLLAIIQPSSKNPAESSVEIRAVGGKSICQRDFGSPGGDHGKRVVEGAWTPDSQFFVWSMENSGGHSPWNWPTYVFDRKSSKVLSLDQLVGGITTSAVIFKGSHTLTTERLDTKRASNVPCEVKLDELLRRTQATTKTKPSRP